LGDFKSAAVAKSFVGVREQAAFSESGYGVQFRVRSSGGSVAAVNAAAGSSGAGA
jgi:hypothetical protein